jgi:hypothetical protein
MYNLMYQLYQSSCRLLSLPQQLFITTYVVLYHLTYCNVTSYRISDCDKLCIKRSYCTETYDLTLLCRVSLSFLLQYLFQLGAQVRALSTSHWWIGKQTMSERTRNRLAGEKLFLNDSPNHCNACLRQSRPWTSSVVWSSKVHTRHGKFQNLRDPKNTIKSYITNSHHDIN